MVKQQVQRTFTFENPNTPKEFERQLQKLVLDKLQAQQQDWAAVDCGKEATNR